MDVFYGYTYGSAAWLATQAVPLLIAPKLIITLLAEEAHTSTDIEIYLSRALALTLLTLATLLILLTGSIPLTTDTLEATESEADGTGKAPYAVPSILVSTVFHSLSAFYTYARYSRTRQSAYALAALVWTGLASVGLWCLMFGSEKGHISKRTGADKRTSGWPFKNAEADRKRTHGVRKDL